ncbi:MAG: hypothetical protein FJ091_06275 [Deltaproteobacteria bacterium]|nr:hypothetical protein [Deltaproteobacteria bacterium]
MWSADSRRKTAAALIALAALLGAPSALAAQDLMPAAAQGTAQKRPARFEATVLSARTERGVIDPAAERLHKLLARRGISYGSLRVVAQQESTLMLGDIDSVMTPNGKAFRFRPLDRGDTGFLVAVDWGSTRGDFRMEPGVPLILGGQPKDGALLWVVLELR